MSSNGKMTKAYSDLMKRMHWDKKPVASTAAIKSILGHHNDRFVGWGQQDSMEAMMQVLDILNNDLYYKDQEKPYFANNFDKSLLKKP